MPWLKIRLKDEDYNNISKFTRDFNLSVSQVLLYGMDYVNIIRGSKSVNLLKKTDELLIEIMKKSFDIFIKDFENKVKTEFENLHIQDQFKKEIISEVKTEEIKKTDTQKKQIHKVKKN